jgi:hypothetical protein
MYPFITIPENSPSFLNQKLSNHIEEKKKYPTMRRLKV